MNILTKEEIHNYLVEEFGEADNRKPIYAEAELNVLIRDKIKDYITKRKIEVKRGFTEDVFNAVCCCING